MTPKERNKKIQKLFDEHKGQPEWDLVRELINELTLSLLDLTIQVATRTIEKLKEEGEKG